MRYSTRATAGLDAGGVTADSRTVKTGDIFVAIAGGKADGMRFVHSALAAGASAIVAEQPPETPPPANSVRARRKRPARARAHCGKVLSAPAGHHCRRHRHQRQNIRCGVHAADLERAGSPRREHRHDRHRVAERRDLWLAHHAGSGRAASLDRRTCRRRRHASRDRGVVARSRPIPARRLAHCGRGLHQYHARSSRLSSDVRGLSRGQAAAVRGFARTWRDGRHRRRSRPCRCRGSGREEARPARS